MSAAAVPLPSPNQEGLEADLRRLRLMLVGLKSDVDELSGPLRHPQAVADARIGARKALQFVEALQEKIRGS